jgi:4-alpha-glucanotransferase
MKLHPDKKLAGILEPVFAIRTETDLGIGDTDGVRQMIDWCHRHGLSILQVLPINETSDDNSPYNAISSMALDPTTIAISPDRLPDLSTAKFKELARPELLAELRHGAVQYPEVKQLKRDLLWAAFQGFRRKHWKTNSARAGEFRSFLAENEEWISDYAMFRVLMEDYHNWPTWDEWPADRQSPKRAWTWYLGLPEAERAAYTERLQFVMYVQWIAFGQWQEVKAYGTEKKVHLMGDIPFGVCRYSADVWGNRGVFDLDWNGGAPPEKVFKTDPFTEKWGQNWGIPHYRWEVMRERGFEWWRTRIGNVHKVFHLFRIDHLLGFFRIYSFPWQPKHNDRFLPLTEEEAAEITGGRLPGFLPYADDTEEHRAANQQQGEDLLRMVIDAAGDTAVVAEDLGMVPKYVPPTLEKLEIPGFKIPNFLQEEDGSFVDASRYPRVSLATIATHDHPPIAFAWRDLWRRVDDGDDAARHELGLWMKYAGLDGQDPPRDFAEFHRPILRAVLASNSWLAVFMITDLFAQETRFNAPGAVTDSNWSHRMELTVSEMGDDPDLSKKAEMMAGLVAETGRLA